MAADKQRRAFISYSRTNKEFATKLTRGLRSAGYPVWFDLFDIPTGVRWDDEVEKALRECSIFMIILTPASIASENVKDEIGYAIDHRKRILPVLLEECDVPLRLRRFQYVDFTTKSFEEGFESAKELLGDLVDEATTPVIARTSVVEEQLEKKAETERKAKEEADRLAMQKAEAERLAKQRAEVERLVKAEADRKAKEEADRLAAQKAEAERLARQKVEDERLLKAETERKAKEEADRLAAQKAEAERLARQKVEEERLAQSRVEMERKAKEEADRLAMQKVEAERLAKQKDEDERFAKVKAEAERKAKEEANRLTTQKAEEERLAKKKAEEVEQTALIEADGKAKAEVQRVARLKAEEEQRAREKQDLEKKRLQAKVQLPKPVTAAQSPEAGSVSLRKKSRMPLVIGVLAAVVVVLMGIVVVAAANMFQEMIPDTGSQIESPPAETSIVVNPPTKVQKIVNTPTVRPSPTAGPQKLFTEEFDGDISNWTYFVSKNDTTADASSVEPIADNDFLVLDLGKWLNVYVMYEPFIYTNVRLDARAENRGTNNNNINLVCRYSDEGWYEVAIANNGLYDIYAFDGVKGSYNRLANGGSNKIKAGNEVNEYTFICNDSALTLQINGFDVKTYTDNQYDFRDGQIGFGASSFENTPVKVNFDWLKISEP